MPSVGNWGFQTRMPMRVGVSESKNVYLNNSLSHPIRCCTNGHPNSNLS